ncbi:unc-45 myosin chaperone [Arctopsyche grandis]|uniref:unc-45 myosin chaperone n=1 Tax=Arctopsyche grandis TaxID=121162 RepID=UPI00406D93AE
MASAQIEAEQLKSEGNAAFGEGRFEQAVELYSRALKRAGSGGAAGDSRDVAVYYKNRAAAHLKLGHAQSALDDCEAALRIAPEDPKSLFRRAQALESLERYEEAYRDARAVLNAEPANAANAAVQPLLARLFRLVQERASRNAQTENRVEQMFAIAFDPGAERDKRETAASNLLVLAKQAAGAHIMFEKGVVRHIRRLLKLEKSAAVALSCIRIVAQLCEKSVERVRGVIEACGIPWFLELIDSDEEQRVAAAQYCMQCVLNAFSGMDNKPESKPDQRLCDLHKPEIDTLLTCLTCSITNRVISGRARDAVVELVMKNCHYTALSWAERFVEIKGVHRLLEVCSELDEYRYESAMNVTPSSRTVAAVCLAKIYENMYYDQAREKFTAQVDDFVKDKLLNPDIESKVRVTVAITSLLLGPLDVGNAIVSKDGIVEMILVMAGTDDVLQQKVACECLIAAASKKDKAKAIINQGVNILKTLYKSRDDGIKVRALVGLCKLSSSGGTDASIRPFADGSTTKLAEACRRFLVNPSKDHDMRRWAAEGLSYLTLDADVKEKMVEDKPAIRALVELANTGDQSAVYGVVTTLVNLCNAYEKQELVPEMVELAKFAKHHIPEEHELDDPDFVSKRLCILAKEGVTTALVALSKTQSDNSKELISRVFNALCSQQELRGIVVQQGAVKVLLPMALEGTANGKKQAAQALARIGITINPEVAFPGQRSLEIVRPLSALLHPDCAALENFESLLALCNLASMNETCRQRILKECGLAKIEAFLFEEHQMLRRAATQVLTNMVQSEDVVKMHEDKNDRVKFLCLLCQEEDEDTALAAAGALAILTGASKKCCSKILDSSAWLETLHCLLANPNAQIQHRGLYTLLNVFNNDKEVAEKIIATDVMEILMALTKLQDESRKVVIEYAEKCLKVAKDMKLIQTPEEAAKLVALKEEEEDEDD